MTIPWHFTPKSADLPIEQFRERLYHPDSLTSADIPPQDTSTTE